MQSLPKKILERARAQVSAGEIDDGDELYILYRRIAQLLADAGIEIVFRLVGPFVTSMEMAGASITVMEVDDELLGLLNAACDCPHWRAQ